MDRHHPTTEEQTGNT